jgi:hypothetical protein
MNRLISSAAKKPAAIFTLLLIACLLLLFSRFYLTGSVVAGDGVYYYCYIRSLVIDRDLDFTNEYQHFYNERSAYSGNRKLRAIPDIVPDTGRLPNKYPIGSAIALLPFFIFAHILTLLVNKLGGPLPADGYSAIYQLATATGSLLYAFVGVLLIFRLGRKLFNAEAALIGSISIWLATPLIYYMTIEPLMSHAISMFAVALFIFLWLRAREHRALHQWLLLGLIGGLMSMVRYQDLLFLGLPIIDSILLWWRNRKPRAEFAQVAMGNLILLIAAGLVISLQLYINKIFYGSPLRTGYATQSHFNWGAPKLLYTLFSTHNGLLLFSPIIIFSLIGLCRYAREHRFIGLLLIGSLLAQWYLISSWSFYTQGATFGNRMLLNATMIFAIGLIDLLAGAQKKKFFYRIIIALCCGSIVFNSILAAFYCLRIIRDPYLLAP